MRDENHSGCRTMASQSLWGMGVSSLRQWLSLSYHLLSSVLCNNTRPCSQISQDRTAASHSELRSSVLVPEVHFGVSCRKFNLSITSFAPLLPPQCRRRQTPPPFTGTSVCHARGRPSLSRCFVFTLGVIGALFFLP